MAIIRYTKEQNIQYAYLNVFPDQFKSAKQKQDDSWVKNTMDYFATKAYAEYIKNRDTFVKNYDLMKGILSREDFLIDEPEVKSFTDMLQSDLELPSYVKHYSIVTTPINELVGEISKRPDAYRVKAFDDDSQAQELQFKTDTLQAYVINQVKQQVMAKAAMSGQEISMEDVEAITMEQVKEQLDTYTSVAEKWANHTLTAQKAEFNLKEKGEDAFRDLLISAREFYHIYEDNSKLGFNIEVANPKNTWFLTTPDKKYISDPTGRSQGAYAAGTVEVMELSEIIEAHPDLTKQEIDHLRTSQQDYGLINARESNLGNPNVDPGIDSINYDTYDPLVLQTRMIIESEIKENNDGLQDFLGVTNNVSAFGNKYVVIRSYWISKKKIGKLTYTDEMGNEQSTLVDENYKSGDIPTQIALEWGWINEWYQGTKIGPDIYHVKPYKLLNYCPIIGTTYEVKNTEARSLVDLMKPFQLIGMSRQRMGSVAASETATATNTAMQQSYSQTEPLFIAHEYVMGQLYQGIIDASLYIESSKPQSTLSYITSEGESAFVQVNGSDLTLRDLKVFLTNRPEDTQMFNELRQLAQAIIQNGGTLYDIIELYSTKSMREMKKTFKDLRDRQVQQQEQQMQMQQQQQEQAGKIAQGQMQQTEQLAAQKQANENYQNELDRINKKEIAMINAMSKEGEATADLDNSGTPDSLEIEKIASQQSIAKSNYNSKMADINSKNTVAQQKLQIEREKIKLARDNQANDLAVAKMNAKGRSK